MMVSLIVLDGGRSNDSIGRFAVRIIDRLDLLHLLLG